MMVLLAALATPASAARPVPRPSASPPAAATAPARPPGELIDRLIADKLVWSTIIAIDQANRTGDYSVVRALGSASFQQNNPPARLAQIFEALRVNRVDLSNILILSPVYEQAPMVSGGVLRTKGVFPLRPYAIGFDLLFERNGGGWQLLGVYVTPLIRNNNQIGR